LANVDLWILAFARMTFEGMSEIEIFVTLAKAGTAFERMPEIEIIVTLAKARAHRAVFKAA
jgi:hypothetical protein